MTTYCIIIVIYKAAFSESQTIKSLLQQNGQEGVYNITIWDNSPTPQFDPIIFNELSEKFGNVEYKFSPSNVALSIIYNKIILEKSCNYNIIFDQDSSFNLYYLSNIEVAVNTIQHHHNIGILCPVIMKGSQIISPGGFGRFKGCALRSIDMGINDSRNRCAITSGIVIKMNVFDSIGWFNENLNLYAIDTDFFLRYRRTYDYFYVLDTKIAHDSALRNKIPLEQMIFRFKNLRRSHIIMFDNIGRERISIRIYMAYLSIRYAVKYKSFKFLF